MPEQFGKLIILIGLALIIIGLMIVFQKALPFGKLPGDIVIQKGNFSFYFPLTTCIIISIVLTVIFFFIGKR
jgi:uncharacterized protein HemY